jgi:hypothetical protein
LESFDLDGFVVRRGLYVVSDRRRTLSPAADLFRHELLKAGAGLLAEKTA